MTFIVKNNKIISKKLSKYFFEKYDINVLHRPSKLAIAEVAGMSAGRVILYGYVATEKNHTVEKRLPLYIHNFI